VPEPGALRTVLAFPSTYTVGITSLGYQIVWATLAMRPDLDVRRLFTDHSKHHHRHCRHRRPPYQLTPLISLISF